MSVKIISLNKNNNMYKEIEELSSFQSVLPSRHDDVVKDATDSFIFKLITLQNHYYDIKYFIYKKFNIIVVVGSGYRTQKINELIGGSTTSQHKDVKALDLHFFEAGGDRIRGKDKLLKFQQAIDEKFGNMIIQMFLYEWGLHVGFFDENRSLIYRRGVR